MHGLPCLCPEPIAGGTKQGTQSLASAPGSSHTLLTPNPDPGDHGWLLLTTSRQMDFGCAAVLWREQMMGRGAGGREGFVLVLAEQREPGEAV